MLRDLQGLWEGWEAWVGLSMLSTDRHFHGLPFCFRSFLLSLEGSAKAVGLGSGLEDVRPICDAIDQCYAEPGIRNHLRPLGKGKVGSQDHRGPFGSFSDYLKQKLSTDFGQWDIANLVDGDQIVAAPPCHHAP